MDNRINKPKKTAAELVAMLRGNKGVTFSFMSEEDAVKHLTTKNNYLRTSAYRKNYDRYTDAEKNLTGKYKYLDFAYLVELSRIDTQLRYLIMAMCLDIEHYMRVALMTAIEKNPQEDGYTIAYDFLDANQSIQKSIEVKANSTFCGNLIKKYFVIEEVPKIQIKRIDCPAWVLLEIMSFGDLIKFYRFYNERYHVDGHINTKSLSAVKSLRNAAAHNNCIINDLKTRGTKPTSNVLRKISQIPAIGRGLRQSRLSIRAIFEFISLLIVYDDCVRGNARKKHITQLRNLFFERILEHKDYFTGNDALVSSYKFVAQIIQYLFDKEA